MGEQLKQALMNAGVISKKDIEREELKSAISLSVRCATIRSE